MIPLLVLDTNAGISMKTGTEMWFRGQLKVAQRASPPLPLAPEAKVTGSVKPTSAAQYLMAAALFTRFHNYISPEPLSTPTDNFTDSL